ncbi:putative disease resistance protein Aig2 [Talaromyces proteolyticus]|uniref:Putative gamma-glutamylcyclotransferase n=1 Tax=Talaromyces proteolyticus TaxID=1131652 RepID=A0AAD4L0Z1_9EURO|nr:putative disease resistance protein Aig2 [Talaromyces proteolyticus]KAH8702131.1 putative disease resistance protein Aig2 [Talaromyces proteolyticus]
MGDYTFFFYGTLMAPAILHRIIHGSSTPEVWQKSLIISRPALLPGYRRYRVHNADYPALTPSDSADSPPVLGTIVTGITEGDIYRLDRFEGSEYEKCSVRVKVLRGAAQTKCGEEGDGSLQHALEKTANAGCDESAFREMEEVEAMTYVWKDGKERLDVDQEWDYEHFKKEKMQWWVEADESEL